MTIVCAFVCPDVSCSFSIFRMKAEFELKYIKLILNGKTLSPGVYFALLINMCTLMCEKWEIFEKIFFNTTLHPASVR